jgi:hypothetical protein
MWVLALCAMTVSVSGLEGVNVKFDGETPLFKVRPSYLSFNIDTGSFFNNIDMKDRYFINLVKSLSLGAPSQIRVGGSGRFA